MHKQRSFMRRVTPHRGTPARVPRLVFLSFSRPAERDEGSAPRPGHLLKKAAKSGEPATEEMSEVPASPTENESPAETASSTVASQPESGTTSPTGEPTVPSAVPGEETSAPTTSAAEELRNIGST